MISISDIAPLFAKGCHHPTMLTILQALLILIGEVRKCDCFSVCSCVCMYVCVHVAAVCAYVCVQNTHTHCTINKVFTCMNLFYGQHVGKPQNLPLYPAGYVYFFLSFEMCGQQFRS